MRIFVDIDGTLTKEQRAESAFRSGWRTDMIEKVKQLIGQGHEIVLWSGSTEYAKRAAKHFGIDAVCLGKPQLIVDNEDKKWSKRLCERVITPESFLDMHIETEGE